MIINKPRQSGKTHDLIITAHYTGYPIIVRTQAMKDITLGQAKSMGYDIDVLTVYEWRDRSESIGYRVPILVDELSFFIEDAIKNYFNADVVSATITLPMEELKNETDD